MTQGLRKPGARYSYDPSYSHPWQYVRIESGEEMKDRNLKDYIFHGSKKEIWNISAQCHGVIKLLKKKLPKLL